MVTQPRPSRLPVGLAVGLAVLAAGRGDRFGTPKAEVVAGGRTLLTRAAEAAVAAGSGPVALVVRRPPPGPVPDAQVVVNQQADTGQRSSLSAAVAWATGSGLAALGVLLVDQPGVGADAIRSTAGAWRPGRAARASYADGPGHPLVMGLDDWREALTLAGPDEGARGWLRLHADRVDLVAAAGSAFDLDTPADLAAWERRGR